jgi:hypothetical protein
MPLSLEKLEKLVSELNDINTIKDGYPILHHAILSLDRSSGGEHERYFSLFSKILKKTKCNPDILDKYSKSPLMYAAEGNQKNLCNLLLQHRANPNLLSGEGKTALEYAIELCPKGGIVRLLIPITNKTDRLLKNCQELFNVALDEAENAIGDTVRALNVDIMNELLDFDLAKYQGQERPLGFYKITKDEKDDECTGFWVRVIRNPGEERVILEKREKNSGSVYADRHPKGAIYKSGWDKNSTFTEYSSCTFLRRGIPIQLFLSGSGSKYASLLIRPSQASIYYWYDGRKEELTDNVDLDTFKNKPLNAGYNLEISARKIEKSLVTYYLRLIEEYKKQYKEKPSLYDKYQILLEKELDMLSLSWNEGLLRYRHEDVLGVCVCENSRESAISALRLISILNLQSHQARLFYYDQKRGSFTKIDQMKLISHWEISKDELVVSEKFSPIPSLQPQRLQNRMLRSDVFYKTINEILKETFIEKNLGSDQYLSLIQCFYNHLDEAKSTNFDGDENRIRAAWSKVMNSIKIKGLLRGMLLDSLELMVTQENISKVRKAFIQQSLTLVSPVQEHQTGSEKSASVVQHTLDFDRKKKQDKSYSPNNRGQSAPARQKKSIKEFTL